MYPTSSDRFRRKAPTVEMSVDVEEAMVAVVDLLRAATNSIETLTNTVNERFNSTFIDAGDKVGNIIGDINTITHNIADATNNLNHPTLTLMFLYGLFMFFVVLLLIFIVVLLLCTLKTSREFKKRKNPRSISSSPSNGSVSPAKRGLIARLPEWARKKRGAGSGRLRHTSVSPPAMVIGRRNVEADFPPIDSHYSTSPTLPITKEPSTNTLV